MFKYLLLIFGCFCFILFSCKNKTKTVETKASPTDTSLMYAFAETLQSDIDHVKQTPYLITQTKFINKVQKDSVIISLKDYEAIAKKIIATTFIKDNWSVHYKESLFRDLTTKSIVLTYNAIDTNIITRSMTVLLNEETNTAKNIFISCFKADNDSTVSEKYNWKIKKSFSITRFVKYKNGKEKEEINYINWNDHK